MNLSENLALSVEESTRLVTNLLSGLPEEAAKEKPEDGKWSVLECIEHLYLVEKGIVRLLTKAEENAGSPDETNLEKFGAGKMRHILSNRNQRYAAPDPFVPKGTFSSLEEAKQALTALRTQLITALQAGQITFTSALTIPHPRMGEFTKLDWVRFLTEHASRHYQQIEELKLQLAPGQ